MTAAITIEGSHKTRQVQIDQRLMAAATIIEGSRKTTHPQTDQHLMTAATTIEGFHKTRRTQTDQRLMAAATIIEGSHKTTQAQSDRRLMTARTAVGERMEKSYPVSSRETQRSMKPLVEQQIMTTIRADFSGETITPLTTTTVELLIQRVADVVEAEAGTAPSTVVEEEETSKPRDEGEVVTLTMAEEDELVMDEAPAVMVEAEGTPLVEDALARVGARTGKVEGVFCKLAS